MPIRIKCPSCSATLSVRDDVAGRAVKCPKCAGVIPPSAQPAPTASEPDAIETLPHPPAAPAPMDLPDEPAKTAKTGSKVIPRAAARSKDEEDEEDDRPRRKRRDDDEDDRDDDRPRRKRRDDDDDDDDRDERSRKRDRDRDDDDRPRRKRRDDDEDDRPGHRRKPGKSNAGTIAVIAVVGLVVLLVGGGGLAWYLLRDDAPKDSTEDKRGATKANYDNLKIATTTRKQADDLMGSGKAATGDDIEKIFSGDATRIDKWKPMAERNRVVIWRTGDDILVAGFHLNAEPDAKLQMKEWKSKNWPALSEGEVNDFAFAVKYSPAKSDDLKEPAVEVTGEELSRAYGENTATADAKYKGKVVFVEGALADIELSPDGTMFARLSRAPDGGLTVRVNVWPADMNRVFACSRVQSIKFKGRCNGLVDGFVDVTNGMFEIAGPDPSFPVTAARLLSDYSADQSSAEERYRDKQLLMDAVIDSLAPDAVYLIAAGKAKFELKIKMAVSPEFRKQFDGLRRGALIRVRGESGGVSGGEFLLTRGWLSPPSRK